MLSAIIFLRIELARNSTIIVTPAPFKWFVLLVLRKNIKSPVFLLCFLQKKEVTKQKNINFEWLILSFYFSSIFFAQFSNKWGMMLNVLSLTHKEQLISWSISGFFLWLLYPKFIKNHCICDLLWRRCFKFA
jgi:hypothetical protein